MEDHPGASSPGQTTSRRRKTASNCKTVYQYHTNEVQFELIT